MKKNGLGALHLPASHSLPLSYIHVVFHPSSCFFSHNHPFPGQRQRPVAPPPQQKQPPILRAPPPPPIQHSNQTAPSTLFPNSSVLTSAKKRVSGGWMARLFVIWSALPTKPKTSFCNRFWPHIMGCQILTQS